MGNRLLALGIALTAILAAIVCVPAAADTHYAVGISSGRVYLFGVGAGSNSVTNIYNFGSSGVGLSDVATNGNYVFVSDKAAGKVYVLEVTGGVDGTPSGANKVGEISLNTSSYTSAAPVSLAVTSSGQGIYVLGTWTNSSFTTSRGYAYLSKGGDWNSATPQIGDFGGSSTAGIAMLSDGENAIAALATDGTYAKETQATTLTGTTRNGTASANLSDIDAHAFSPQGIAVNNDKAYVINYYYDADDSKKVGGITVFDTSGPTTVSTIRLPDDNTRPSRITAFSLGDTDYLAMVVATENASGALVDWELWRVGLSSGGSPTLSSITAYPLGNGTHYLAASADGEVLWVSNPADESVSAIGTAGWSLMAGGYFSSLGEGVLQMADLDYHYVPEPSSLAALCSFGLGAIGFARFRKRRA